MVREKTSIATGGMCECPWRRVRPARRPHTAAALPPDSTRQGPARSTRDRFEGEGNGPWGRAAGSSVLLLLLCKWAFACGLQCCVVRPRARAHARFRAVMFLSVYIYVALARLRSRATSHRRTRATCVLCLRLPCDGVYLPCSLRGCGRSCVFVRAARMALGRPLWGTNFGATGTGGV
jgi:hypothetical protein